MSRRASAVVEELDDLHEVEIWRESDSRFAYQIRTKAGRKVLKTSCTVPDADAAYDHAIKEFSFWKERNR